MQRLVAYWNEPKHTNKQTNMFAVAQLDDLEITLHSVSEGQFTQQTETEISITNKVYD